MEEESKLAKGAVLSGAEMVAYRATDLRDGEEQLQHRIASLRGWTQMLQTNMICAIVLSVVEVPKSSRRMMSGNKAERSRSL